MKKYFLILIFLINIAYSQCISDLILLNQSKIESTLIGSKKLLVADLDFYSYGNYAVRYEKGIATYIEYRGNVQDINAQIQCINSKFGIRQVLTANTLVSHGKYVFNIVTDYQDGFYYMYIQLFDEKR